MDELEETQATETQAGGEPQAAGTQAGETQAAETQAAAGQRPSSIGGADGLAGTASDQFAAPTLGIVAVLVVVFFALKAFIYIKDPKRQGK